MPTKPGNGDVESKTFDLKIGKPSIYFNNPRIGWVYTPGKVTVTNPTKDRYTYKTKCTNNQMFDIKIPVGFIEPGETIDITVLHVPGFLIPDDDVHHLSIYYIKCEQAAVDYGPIWRSKKPEGCKHVFICFPKQHIMTTEQKRQADAKKKEEKVLKKNRLNWAREEQENLEKERREGEEAAKKAAEEAKEAGGENKK